MKQKKPDPDIALLLNTLDKLGVEVRCGVFDSEGGLARIEDRYILFLHDAVTLGREKELCLDAIRKMDPALSHVPPRVRILLGEGDWGDQGATDG
ncbi:MAG TPA: hypothetical protein VLX68_07025 [Chitinivibrionales bacterium]|nr:hypothetical protein [Chitinivibrionales bacterium]